MDVAILCRFLQPKLLHLNCYNHLKLSVVFEIFRKTQWNKPSLPACLDLQPTRQLDTSPCEYCLLSSMMTWETCLLDVVIFNHALAILECEWNMTFIPSYAKKCLQEPFVMIPEYCWILSAEFWWYGLSSFLDVVIFNHAATILEYLWKNYEHDASPEWIVQLQYYYNHYSADDCLLEWPVCSLKQLLWKNLTSQFDFM